MIGAEVGQAAADRVGARKARAWLWLTVGELAAIAVFTVPSLFYSSGSPPPPIVVTQVLVGGVLLGCGRQGIDLLAVRVLLAFSAVFVVTELDHTATQVACSGATECVRTALLAVLGLGLVSAFFGVLVVPVTVIWNRGFRSLAPEFAWHRLKDRPTLMLSTTFVSLGRRMTDGGDSLQVPARTGPAGAGAKHRANTQQASAAAARRGSVMARFLGDDIVRPGGWSGGPSLLLWATRHRVASQKPVS